MDFATLIGVVIGISLVIGSILLGSSAGVFFHIPSIMITVGGTIAATLINFPIEKVKGVFAVVKKALLFSLPDPHDQIKKIIKYNNAARRDGIMVLEDKMAEMYPFLRNGIQLILDNTEAETIRKILERDIELSQMRHGIGKKILDSMGASAPAFGMIGTLIGLVQMLQNLQDPSQIGQGMAVALLTTFYGALLANLVFIPLAGKLEARDYEEQVLHEIILEGVLSIQAGDHPYIMKQRLKCFVSSQQRDSFS